MTKEGKRILKSVRKARVFASETAKAVPTGKISDVFGCLKKPGRRALSAEQMSRVAERGWAGKK
ncbi:MAG: hypothetical protein EPO08_09840 [Rhodospirillaceae bacterium]|nr:MAG: hypothetical protein EPO08_09840 [Rhodospirillaceae bacterium]